MIDQQTMIKVKGTPYKSYLEQFVPPWNYARQYIADSLGNMRKFLKGNFHMGLWYESLNADILSFDYSWHSTTDTL